MGFRKKLGVLKNYYASAHGIRRDFFNLKWRLFVILLAALLVLFVNDYLQNKYAATAVIAISPDGTADAAPYALPDKLFNWFMTGVLFGIVALGVLNEGEFILGLRRMIMRFERDAERGVKRALRGEGNSHPLLQGGQRRKNVKQRKK